MTNPFVRSLFSLLLVLLFLFNLCPLPATAFAEDPPPQEPPVCSPDDKPEEDENKLLEQGLTTPAPEEMPALREVEGSGEEGLGQEPQNNLPAQAASSSSTQEEEEPPGGNSYVASVRPEEGTELKKGEKTNLVIIFTEVGTKTTTGSAEISIPDTLKINQEEGLKITEGWDYAFDDTVPDGFSAVLKLWAILGDTILKNDQSVTVGLSVTALIDSEHTFKTKAWLNRDVDENGLGVGVGTNNNYMHTDYEEPKCNVLVNNKEDLEKMRQNLNWHYVQKADIVFAEDEQFMPIGGKDTPFTGAFHGNGFKISNLNIKRPDEDYNGLFGQLSASALLNNITLENCHIEGENQVGGLAGDLRGGSILNSTVSGTILANRNFAGGVAGSNTGGLIFNTHAAANVSGTFHIGGLCGKNFAGSKILHSSAAGIIGGDSFVGGLVGENYSSLIENSQASGKVTASNTNNRDPHAGGLVGYNRKNSIIEGCSSAADVSASSGSYTGGLVGYNSESLITVSFATGPVEGQDNTGGLVGYNYTNGIINNCYATGIVNGANSTGGLVGFNVGTIRNTYAAGMVTGGADTGGLVGKSGGDSHFIAGSFYLSGRPNSSFGAQVEPAALKDLATFTDAGWHIQTPDTYNPADEVPWFLDPLKDFPILWWQHKFASDTSPETPGTPISSEGGGEVENQGGHNFGLESLVFSSTFYPGSSIPQKSLGLREPSLLLHHLYQLLHKSSKDAHGTLFNRFMQQLSQIATLLKEALLNQNQHALAQAQAAYLNMFDDFNGLPQGALTKSEEAQLSELLATLGLVFTNLAGFNKSY